MPARADIPTLHVLCAGAAQGLLTKLEPVFSRRHGVRLAVRFNAVGALRDALRAGDACDVFIATDAMVTTLGAAGDLLAEQRQVLGWVHTGIAVRHNQPAPDISDAQALGRALNAASVIHCPDTERATAGVHFTGVLRRLGLFDALSGRLRSYPNGATAMRALADSAGAGQLGCTQVSEIVFTAGLRLVGPLPTGYELVTPYAAAVTARSSQTTAAEALVSMLAAASMASLRAECGIEPLREG